MEHEKLSRKSKGKRVENGCRLQRVKIYRFKRTYKAGDTIVIETDSKEFLDKAKKEYAKYRKGKKAKKKPSKNPNRRK